MALNRNYNYKDVDMLMASKTITKSFTTNLPELSTIRTNWTEEYALQLDSQIDDAIDNQLGVDKKKELRNATGNLQAIQLPAMRDLSFLKTQLEVDFSHDKPKLSEMLNTLGFSKHLKQVQKKDQEALIALLYHFKQNLSDELRSIIISKGINPALLDRVIGYAGNLKQANVSQETLKTETKSVSKDITLTFNTIYNEIIGICKIASNYYQYDELKKDQFTFAKVIANMNAARKISEPVN
ncbi:hypothetical protein [Saccharicrinis aurantiacus]|uniref:hypothetical protein n=1 Tax=Saccharicrinis aurantiacus TaxID=1849719 RepID=UPI002491116C|nr:hypothetical protein [Saccharicrinis aurantiacus]